MSQANYGNIDPSQIKKPKTDAYSTMLIVSVLALTIAIVVLCLELNRYEWKIDPNSMLAPAPAADRMLG